MIRLLTTSACLFFLLGSEARAWNEAGHHLIVLIAFDLLPETFQQSVQELIDAHPEYDSDFEPPKSMTAPDQISRWRIGRIGSWPDYIRRTKYDRPNWHFEPTATLVIGDESKVSIPEPLPYDRTTANLQTKNLHLAQALHLCVRILGDKSQSSSNRSIALCWVAHLIADAHQPLHAGNAYAPGALSNGDRGGNEIPTKQGKNLHSLWDGLLGKKADNAMNRRMVEITTNFDLVAIAKESAPSDKTLRPSVWLRESREMALSYAYTADIQQAITEASRAGLPEVNKITLSKEYLKNAGRVAQTRAIQAGYRLAATLRKSLQ